MFRLLRLIILAAIALVVAIWISNRVEAATPSVSSTILIETHAKGRLP
jgi:hypothetical protein